MNLQIINNCAGTDTRIPTAGTDLGGRCLICSKFHSMPLISSVVSQCILNILPTACQGVLGFLFRQNVLENMNWDFFVPSQLELELQCLCSFLWRVLGRYNDFFPHVTHINTHYYTLQCLCCLMWLTLTHSDTHCIALVPSCDMHCITLVPSCDTH